MSTTTTYTVSGMSCSQCVAAVTEEVTKIQGVVDVQVELSSGAVQVTSEQPPEDSAIRTAVEEAGYELVSV